MARAPTLFLLVLVSACARAAPSRPSRAVDDTHLHAPPPATADNAASSAHADVAAAPEAEAKTAASPGSGASERVALSLDVRVPMRDGVMLSATIYRGAAEARRRPVVVDVTPYAADTNHAWASYFARHGLIGAVVDLRGRGDSGGVFDPWHAHPGDMSDLVEWLATQPWSDGHVAMFGSSYAGMTQWWAARETPPHLRTIVPMASGCSGVDFPFRNGIPSPYDLQWLYYVGGHSLRGKLFGDGDFWATVLSDFLVEGLPFRALDRFVGTPSPAFQEMLKHPAYDAFWQASRPSADEYRKIAIPVLTVTGYYDDDQQGALTYYREHREARAANGAAAEHYVVIGPWDHGGTRDPKRDLGGLRFGAESAIDMKSLLVDWYAWTMSAAEKPTFFRDRVAYYVTGVAPEEWRYAPALEHATKARKSLYLGSSSAGSDRAHPGFLQSTPPAGLATSVDRYTFDPSAASTREPPPGPRWLVDGRDMKTMDGASLHYESAPLAADTLVVGAMRVSAWLRMDVPDTDLKAVAYEMTSDGKSVLLGQDVLRARYRESPSRERAVPIAAPVRYDFRSFPWIARRLAKGSRLRVVVGALSSPMFQRNYQSGGVVADESRSDARVAHVDLLHDRAHLSVVELPLGE